MTIPSSVRPLLIAALAAACFGTGSLFASQQQQIEIVRIAGPGGAIGVVSGDVTMPVEQTGTGIVVGQVVDANGESPVGGAVVSLGGARPAPAGRGGSLTFGPRGGGRGRAGARTVPRVMTDANGRFAFRNLPEGAFTVTAQKSGYLDGAYGRLRANGASQSLDLAAGERRDDITVRVFRPAAITGRVVDDRGEPVVGANVRAYRRELRSGRRVLAPEGSRVSTDDRGIYRIAGLMPGEYVIAVPTVHQSAPADFSLRNMPADLMSTMVTPGNTNFSYSSGGSQVTPDGAFVLQGGAGQSSVAPEIDGRLLSFATVYYPSVFVASEATPVVVRSGEERQAIDVALSLLPTATIAGRLIGPDGPAPNYALHLVPSDTGDMSSDPDAATAITSDDGSFMFLGVPAGNYVIQTVRVPRSLPRPGAMNTVIQASPGGTMVFSSARVGGPGGATPPPQSTEPTLWTAMPVAVSGIGVEGLALTLQEGLTIAGRVEFEGGAERPAPEQLARISILSEPADGKQRASSPAGRVKEDGQFATPGLLPGMYLVRATSPGPGWTLKSVTFGGIDITENPLELQEDTSGVVVTFTDRPSSLSGVARGSDGSPDSAAAVLVFPADNQAWVNYGTNPRRMRLARASRTGTYMFGALPAGNYHVVAISEEYANDWQDPRFLQQVSAQAARVTIGEGMQATLDLTTQPFRGVSGGHPVPLSEAYQDPQDPEVVAGHGPYVPEGEESIQQVRQARDRFAQPTSGTATVSGAVVLDDGTGTPIRRVRVSLRNAESSIDRAVMTDDQGRFVLQGLPTGRYSLTATKPAYVSTYFGSKQAGRGPGTPLALTEGQVMDGIVMRMPRGAVIAGRVIDEFNQPLQGASIRVMQRQMTGGQRTLQSIPGLLSSVQTDDQGRYRVFGLTPGDYVVMASPRSTDSDEIRQLSTSDVDAALADVRSGSMAATRSAGVGANAVGQASVEPAPFGGRAVGFAPVYYPGTPQVSSAATVTVRPGEEALNIDMTVRLVPMARLEGTITGPDGQPVGGVTALLLPAGDEEFVGLRTLSSIIRTGPDGTFTASNVAPGRYTLTARSNGPGGGTRVMELSGGGMFVSQDSSVSRGGGRAEDPPAKPLWAQETVDVNGEDLTGLALTMREGMTVAGTVMFDGQLARPEDLSTVRIGISPVGGNSISLGVPGGTVEADGTFRLDGVTPGSYRLTAAVPSSGGFTAESGWQLSSAMLNGRDTLDTNLEVQPGQPLDGVVLTFTDKRTELSGTVTDSAGDPVSDLTVLVFPSSPELWNADSRRMPRPQQPGSDGMFRITSLPPGDYRLAVVTEIEPDQWGDAAFMEQVAAASIPITLVAGEQTVQDVRVGGSVAR